MQSVLQGDPDATCTGTLLQTRTPCPVPMAHKDTAVPLTSARFLKMTKAHPVGQDAMAVWHAHKAASAGHRLSCPRRAAAEHSKTARGMPSRRKARRPRKRRVRGAWAGSGLACWRKKIAHARAERQERGGERDIPEHNIDIQSTAQETRPTSTTVKTRTGPQYTPTHVPQELAPLFHCHSTCADEDDAAKLLARTQGTREDAPGKPITGKSKIRSHTGNGGGEGGTRVWGDLCSPW